MPREICLDLFAQENVKEKLKVSAVDILDDREIEKPLNKKWVIDT